jgi:hypothetical protein
MGDMQIASIERWMYRRFHVSVLNHESDMFGCNRDLGVDVCNSRKSRY